MSKTMRMFQQLSVNLLNMQRQRIQAIDYVMIKVPPSFAPMPSKRNFVQQQILGPAPMSLLEFVGALERIADDPRTLGVILYFRGFSASTADLQTMRDAILRLRDKGKRALSFAPGYRTLDYYVASACDEILLPPGGALETTGLFSQQVFLKEGLAAAGLQFDAVAISPYKGAADSLTRTDPSPEGREQTNWLLDSVYEMIVDGIAATRKMKPDAVKQMIDQALHLSEDALEKGFVDGIMSEEALVEYLGVTKITMWEEADGQLYLPVRDFGGKYLAVLYAGGMIVDGESATPPSDVPVPVPFVGGERLGDITLNQQVRNLMKDPQCGALVLYIDSGGGSATASESMASALGEFAKSRPLVVCMGGVAASGGYYIATPAHWIVAQPGTITGSIGVIMGKLVNSESTAKAALQRRFLPARRQCRPGRGRKSLQRYPTRNDPRQHRAHLSAVPGARGGRPRNDRGRGRWDWRRPRLDRAAGLGKRTWLTNWAMCRQRLIKRVSWPSCRSPRRHC